MPSRGVAPRLYGQGLARLTRPTEGAPESVSSPAYRAHGRVYSARWRSPHLSSRLEWRFERRIAEQQLEIGVSEHRAQGLESDTEGNRLLQELHRAVTVTERRYEFGLQQLGHTAVLAWVGGPEHALGSHGRGAVAEHRLRDRTLRDIVEPVPARVAGFEHRENVARFRDPPGTPQDATADVLRIASGVSAHRIEQHGIAGDGGSPGRRTNIIAAASSPHVIMMRAIHTRAPMRARIKLLGTSQDVAQEEHAGAEAVHGAGPKPRSRFTWSAANPMFTRSRKHTM